MTNSVDMIYFQELAEQDPKDVCRRTLCKYDDKNKFYTLSVWGDEYAVYPMFVDEHYVNTMIRTSLILYLFGVTNTRCTLMSLKLTV